MKKIIWGVMLLVWVLPQGLRAELVGSKSGSNQQDSQDADLAAFKLKLAQDPKLTNDQRDALLAERMKRSAVGPNRTSKHVELQQKAAPNSPQSKRAAQGGRTSGKGGNQTGQAKANADPAINSRNVLVR